MICPALAVLAACIDLTTGALQASTVGTPDVGVLLQHSIELASDEKITDDVAGDKLLPLSDIWEQVKEGAEMITHMFGDILRDADRQVDQMQSEAHQATVSLAESLAKSIEEVVKNIQTPAEKLFKDAQRERNLFLDNINKTVLSGSSTVITEFAIIMSEYVHLTDTAWRVLKRAVQAASSVVASALEAAGQRMLGASVESKVDNAVHCVGKFIDKLERANLDFESSASDLVAEDAEALIQSVDEMINNALHHAAQFCLHLQDAFAGLSDSLSSAMTWSSVDIDKAFAPVHQRVTSVVWRVRGASREAVMPLHTGLVRVAKNVGVQPPVWTPVVTIGLQSGAGRIAGLAVAVVLGLCTTTASVL